MSLIAIVDDDVYIGDMLEQVLKENGYRVIRAFSGTEALLLLDKQTPDLLLLDLMMPGLSGEEVLPKIAGIPVIVLSAKIDVDNKVQLLLSGAADYVTKPFDTKELLARIAVQLRKHDAKPNNEKATCGHIMLDAVSRSVTVSGHAVHLTRTEYAILKMLMQNASQVIAKSVMLDRLCADTPDCTESSLKIHVSNLRKKLKAQDGIDYIEAVWGIGFKLKEL